MLTKNHLYRAFNRKISKTMLVDEWCGTEDEWAVVGKYCRITQLNEDNLETWDVFICDPQNMHFGLSERKLKAMIRGLEDRIGRDPCVTMYDGEAGCLMSTDEILKCLDILGIRKAREVSESQKEAFLARIHHVEDLVRA